MVPSIALTREQYRRFGWLLAAALAVFAWRFQSAGLLAAAALLVVLATIWPRSLRRPHALLTALTRPVGLLVGQGLLTLVFFGLIVPLALLFRLLGRDQLHCRPDPDATSYWRPCAQTSHPGSYLRQF